MILPRRRTGPFGSPRSNSRQIPHPRRSQASQPRQGLPTTPNCASLPSSASRPESSSSLSMYLPGTSSSALPHPSENGSSSTHDPHASGPQLFLNFPIHPPARVNWSPFSHTSTEINLLARPDFDNVCSAIYQSHHIGSLFPNHNPPSITLPPLNPIKRIETHANGSQQVSQDLTSGLPVLSPSSSIAKTPAAPRTPSVLENHGNTIRSPHYSLWEALKLPSPNVTTGGKSIKSADPVRESRAPLFEFFSAKVPMTPVRARLDSPYVSFSNHVVRIHSIAYAQDTGRGPQIHCRAIINASYVPDSGIYDRVISTLTYVGFKYPDETCLTYVPIKETRLVYKLTYKRSRSFAEELPMIMRRSLYERIKEMSIRAYLQANPGTKVDCGNVEFQGASVTIQVQVKANRTVRIDYGDYTVYRPLVDAIDTCKHDIVGDSLLHVRFSKFPGRDAVLLKFILFGIQLTKSEANERLRIFQDSERFRN